jgi:hypothetical protein
VKLDPARLSPETWAKLDALADEYDRALRMDVEYLLVLARDAGKQAGRRADRAAAKAAA